MSSSHHDDHHSTEVKPVSFTVPFILASVTLIIMFLFLSLCDPKHGHSENIGTHSHEADVEAAHNGAVAPSEEEHHAAAAEETLSQDSAVAAPAIAPDVEGKPVAGEEHH